MPSGVVSFAAGQASQTIIVSIAGDTQDEGGFNESFTLSLANPGGGMTLGTASAVGLIYNDDAPGTGTLAIARASAQKAEGQSGSTAVTFTVTRSGDTTGIAGADWAVTGGGVAGTVATNGADFVGGSLPSGLITFVAGQTQATVTVLAAADTIVELNESFTVTLSATQPGVTIATSRATGVILNDDFPPSGILSIAGSQADRGEGANGSTALTFIVTRGGNTSGPAIANWEVTGGGPDVSAATVRDFVGNAFPSGTVSFAAGETSKTINVLVVGDNTVESDEGFTVALTSSSIGTSISTSRATGIIRNDDASLAIATTSAAKAEGNAGSTAFTFSVVRSGATNQSSSANWAVTGSGSNQASSGDFVGSILPSGTVSFATGETSKTITVWVAGDTDAEPTENFTIAISGASPGTEIATATAIGAIQNDDTSLLAIATTSAAKAEGDSGSTAFTFSVTRSGATNQSSTAKWAVMGSGSSQASAADFVGNILPSGTVSFSTGETSKTITVWVSGDTASELNEYFAVTLSNPSDRTIVGNATAIGTIQNDEYAMLAIAGTSAAKPEGNIGNTTYSFAVTRSGASDQSSIANWVVTGSGSSPANAADFVGNSLPFGTVSFALGETSRTITVLVSADTNVEQSEEFTVTLSGGADLGTLIGTATASGMIQNDDIPETRAVSVSRLQASRAEGQAATTPFTFLVTRTGDASTPASIGWSVAGGTAAGTVAASASDFVGGVLPSGIVSFAAGQASKMITVNVAGDTTAEGGFNESFSLNLANPSGGMTLGMRSAVGLIYNDDSPGTGTLAIARSSAQKAEGQSGTTAFTFTVTRGGDLTGTAGADWAVTGGGVSSTESANAADFTGGILPSGRVNFAAGQGLTTITVNVAADSTMELNDSFTVTLAAPQLGVAIGTATATGVIVNDDFASTSANQTLTGTDAPDVFLLGGGLDSVVAKAGLDLFRFLPTAIGPAGSNAATLQDFSRVAGEVVDLSAIDAITGTLADDAFSFIGTAAFTAAGQLRWQDQGTVRLIQGEVNGDGIADLTIMVKAPGPIDSTWFAL